MPKLHHTLSLIRVSLRYLGTVFSFGYGIVFSFRYGLFICVWYSLFIWQGGKKIILGGGAPSWE